MPKDVFVPLLGYLSSLEVREIRESIRHKREVSHEGFTTEEWAYMARYFTGVSLLPINALHAYIQTRGRGLIPG